MSVFDEAGMVMADPIMPDALRAQISIQSPETIDSANVVKTLRTEVDKVWEIVASKRKSKIKVANVPQERYISLIIIKKKKKDPLINLEEVRELILNIITNQMNATLNREIKRSCV